MRAAAAVGLACALALVGGADAQRGNMAVQPDESHLYAVTGRAGLLGFLGHDHAITARDWTATLCYLAAEPQSSWIRVRVDAASLRIDTERGLRLAGLEDAPDDDTIADLQERMLGDEFLDADTYPELSFRSTSVAPVGEGALEVEGELQLHGASRPTTVEVRVEREPTGAFVFDAQFAFPMTDVGITPESTAGVVGVADEVTVHVHIVAQRTGDACEAPG